MSGGGAVHIHLDAVGGISGDMFVGAMLACFPELWPRLEEQISLAGFPDLVTLRRQSMNDGVLEGVRFSVSAAAGDQAGHDHGHHHHVHYGSIRDRITGSDLDPAVQRHVLGIFRCLAQAEAAVHGVEVDTVTFHEVGAWDSIADIVCAGYLIEASGAATWSVSRLPLGNGLIDTAHGKLPVPAPAVTQLLEGFAFHEDGIDGERVTPTGAAILRYLNAGTAAKPEGLVLGVSGFGFGSRQFPGLSNVLRALVFTAAGVDVPWREDEVLALAFDIDDQSAEDLAGALDALRALDGVLDVNQSAVTGKKGRSAVRVNVLAETGFGDQVIAACFNETATLGIRHQVIRRAVLPRMSVTVELEGRAYRAKVTQRPSGELTVKADIDDVLAAGLDRAGREALCRDIEGLAFERLLDEQDGGDDDA